MLLSENQFISKILGDKLVDIVFAEEDCFLALKSNGEIKRRLVLSLFSLVKEEHQDSRCSQFYKLAVEVVKRSGEFLELF